MLLISFIKLNFSSLGIQINQQFLTYILCIPGYPPSKFFGNECLKITCNSFLSSLANTVVFKNYLCFENKHWQIKGVTMDPDLANLFTGFFKIKKKHVSSITILTMYIVEGGGDIPVMFLLLQKTIMKL